ncbi:hypothetical protein Tco_0275989 [Tanacetum coccineum]
MKTSLIAFTALIPLVRSLDSRSLSKRRLVVPRFTDVITFLIPLSKGQSVVSIIARLLLAATTYYIWIERNSWLFEKKVSTIPQIVQVITSMVCLKLVSFKFKKLSTRFLFAIKSMEDSKFLYGPRGEYQEASFTGSLAPLVLLLEGEKIFSVTRLHLVSFS